MKRIVIVGGGASGLIAAIYAKKKENEVIILERNHTCGKKLLATGNGRCNYFNQNQDLKYYNTHNKEILKDLITIENEQEILSFFERLGIIPKIKDGYYYPSSNQASSIKNALLLQTELLGIKIKYDSLVTEIKKVDNYFIIKTQEGSIQADKVIVATGSKASPKTGSDGNGYHLVKKLHHSIIEVVPALVQLKGKGTYFKLWNGVRTDVKISLIENNQKIQEEIGEIQLTDYGISGICTFNLSSFVARGLKEQKKEVVVIDFLPFLNISNENEFIDYFDKKNKLVEGRNLHQLLEGILNYKLVEVILKQADIDKNKFWKDLTQKEKYSLYQSLKLFELEILGTNSFDKAQVCSGGVPLAEINSETMESNLIDGLYLTGEILDVDGFCGGYNLSFAWISGMLAGKGASKND